ncbi:MAG: hypothetical protein GX587_11475 [Bacteroidales bacterium]|nr:hypothetical protein [Bacteroidales bacterium]
MHRLTQIEILLILGHKAFAPFARTLLPLREKPLTAKNAKLIAKNAKNVSLNNITSRILMPDRNVSQFHHP